MKAEVLLLLLPEFSDHEPAYLSQILSTDGFKRREAPRFAIKTIAPSLKPIKSIGGITILPDYELDKAPDEYAALILIGGFGWNERKYEEKIQGLIDNALSNNKIVGGICNGAAFLARKGFLNDCKHTGNGKGVFLSLPDSEYNNPHGYVNRQCVADRGIVTANGSAAQEFALTIANLLEPERASINEVFYKYHKQGFYHD